MPDALFALFAHLAGDYLFQSHWMAVEKVRRWWPAVVHGATYTLPFLVITRSPWALLAIGGSHVVLDRTRAVKYLLWAKNLIGPREYRPSLKEAVANCGFTADVPSGLAMAMMIVSDNTVHLICNAAALAWLR